MSLALWLLLVPVYCQSTQDDATKIIDYFTTGAGVGQTYARLANFTDSIGNRLCGSDNYNKAVAYIKDALTADGLTVWGETATVPNWVRGRESLTLVSPRNVSLPLLGLGNSIGTQAYGADGLTADAIVVSSFAELDSLGTSKVSGKIVVYNQQCNWTAQPIECYSTTVTYRGSGASHASQYGAVASLIRTVGSFSIDSPHTGMQTYNSAYPKIPTACITIEDANTLERLYRKGQKITLNLKMEAVTNAAVVQENVIAEIKGGTLPNETVLISGHLDSWDVGVGAMDDGGGAFISWQALSAYLHLGIVPKRTIRMVMWACEEFGGIGGQAYYNAHKSEVNSISIVMESDLGTFTPQGIQFTGTPAATSVMTSVVQLLAPINASTLTDGGEGTDIDPWMNAGVPGASLLNSNDRYFWFHHSQGDRMDVEDPTSLDLCAATWAVTALGVANLDALLPR